MDKFLNILFVSHNTSDEKDALKQAVTIARNNKANLSILSLAKPLPKDLSKHQAEHENGIKQAIQAALKNIYAALGADDASDSAQINMGFGKTPGIHIVRQVLKNNYDLVVMGVSADEKGKGFSTIDMELLRKCPCPVWLWRSLERPDNTIDVAVAIDPDSEEKEGRDLDIQLLKTARMLADKRSGTLNIVSCWDYEHEEHLRNNPWARMPEDEIAQAVANEKSRHAAALDAIIKESGIGGDIKVHHLKGQPKKIIPAFIPEENIDIVVMGTVARTGIAGFSMGNTAESILQNLECSLLALKPHGYVSPVKTN